MASVLLLSAYDAVSHQHWREHLRALLPDIQWQMLTLPPRHFSWRIRSNPLTWHIEQRDVLEKRYDAIIATSMVDLATLRGLVPHLGTIPTAVYFHENQFAYPPGRERHGLLEAQMLSVYSALAADQCWFNSHYNRDTFLTGVDALLSKMPDAVPKGLTAAIKEKSAVVPVPLAKKSPVLEAVPRSDSKPVHLLWNHRWEYDKGPERLCRAMALLVDAQFDFQLSVVGQQFRQHPQAFTELAALFEEHDTRLRHFGFVQQRDEYESLLRQADIVISTALHDFQGLSVLEAAANGCYPLVPNRLAYSEFLPEHCCYESDLNNPQREAQSLADAITGWKEESTRDVVSDFSDLCGERIAKQYTEVINQLISGFAATG